MIRISLPYLYGLSNTFRTLPYVRQGQPLKEVVFDLYGAEVAIQELLSGCVYSGNLKACRESGQTLLQALKKLTSQYANNADYPLDFMDAYSITNGFAQFQTILLAELNVVDVYLVLKKRGFDTVDLIANAEVLFPPDLSIKVPEAITDIREAGKCIAFELATAAGFHLMRATELVLLRYYVEVTSGQALPQNRNIGAYLGKLDQLKVGDPKVIAVLRQIKDLHRNALMHPQANLTLDEALGLLGIAQSAIIAMLAAIPGSVALTAAAP